MVDRNYTVYMHTSPSGKRYIGITGQKISRRWRNGKGYENNEYFTRAIKKYGWDNIQHEIIATGLTKEEAEKMEIELIAYYKSNDFNYGYNIANGGSSIGKHNEETRKKISKANKGKFCGENSPMWGKSKSEETKQKIREKALGRIPSEETKRKMSESHKGEKSYLSKKVFCDNIIFSYTKECSEYYGIKNSTLIGYLNGSDKMPKKLIDLGLRYATEEDINTYPVYNNEIHGEKSNINMSIYIGWSKFLYCENMIFLCIKDCAEYYDIKYGTMKCWVQGKRKMPKKFVDLGLRYATEEDLLEYPIYNKNVK